MGRRRAHTQVCSGLTAPAGALWRARLAALRRGARAECLRGLARRTRVARVHAQWQCRPRQRGPDTHLRMLPPRQGWGGGLHGSSLGLYPGHIPGATLGRRLWQRTLRTRGLPSSGTAPPVEYCRRQPYPAEVARRQREGRLEQRGAATFPAQTGHSHWRARAVRRPLRGGQGSNAVAGRGGMHHRLSRLPRLRHRLQWQDDR